jgi:hypothetical protein
VQTWVLGQQRHVDRRAFAADAAMLADPLVAERAQAERELMARAHTPPGGLATGSCGDLT